MGFICLLAVPMAHNIPPTNMPLAYLLTEWCPLPCSSFSWKITRMAQDFSGGYLNPFRPSNEIPTMRQKIPKLSRLWDFFITYNHSSIVKASVFSLFRSSVIISCYLVIDFRHFVKIALTLGVGRGSLRENFSAFPHALMVNREHRHNTVIMSCLVSKVLLLYIYL